jgi:hypothetical protein
MNSLQSYAFVTIAVIATIAVPCYAFQNEPSGFRGIEWGATIEQAKNKLTQIGQEGKFSIIFRRPDDKMSIGDAELESIRYKFYRGQFSGVYIISKPSTSRAIMQTFRTQFGPGAQPNQYIERFLWDGATSFIFLDCVTFESSCKALIASTALRKIEEADKAAAAAGAKKDF